METVKNPELELAFEFVQYTNKNIFLTGKAGTGKTTFLHNLKSISPKRMIVVAPTGVAAINAGGVTIHSFFQMAFGPYIPNEFTHDKPDTKKFSREKIKILRSLDLLVIDEISMVRSDLLDGIDDVLRRYKNRNRPFGGVQLLMIGDIHQLAPVVKDEEWDILKKYYNSVFFFDSQALQKTEYVSIELKHIYRQSDANFIDLLNKVRENKLDAQSLDLLNKRYNPDILQTEHEDYIILTTHNYQSQKINEDKLAKLVTKSYKFTASVEGDFPPYMYPTEYDLELKVGAQVMFVKNDISRDKLYYNGKIGIVKKIKDKLIYIKCKNDYSEIVVRIEAWNNVRYEIDEQTKEIKEIVIGSFFQYPLKLAWAITIHKSQGLTFEKVIIDAYSAFAFGQVYVALSRCKTLEGIVLSTPLSRNSIKTDETIAHFSSEIEKNPPDKELLNDSIFNYQQIVLFELFDFKDIIFRINYLMKQLNDYLQVLNQNQVDVIRKMDFDFQNEIKIVSDKFRNQLLKLIFQNKNIEENQDIQERSKKACEYFIEKIDSVFIEILKAFQLESDNKALVKQLEDSFENLHQEVFVKKACLSKCSDGFNVKKYLHVKAISLINIPPRIEKKKSKTEIDENATENPLLAKRLKFWRELKADEENIEPNQILHIKIILEIASKLPANLKELSKIKGIGKQKAKLFGYEIIEIVQEYCEEKNIEISKDNEIQILKEESIDIQYTDIKNSGKSKSFDGYSFPDSDKMKCDKILKGELKIDELIERDKIDYLVKYFLSKNPENLTKAKKELGEDYTLSELRFVQYHLQYIKFQN